MAIRRVKRMQDTLIHTHTHTKQKTLSLSHIKPYLNMHSRNNVRKMFRWLRIFYV